MADRDTTGRYSTEPSSAGNPDGLALPADHPLGPTGHDDGHPDADRRESVLDPAAGSSGHRAATIRDQQGTHSAGTVPAAFNGEGSTDRPESDRHPEDAAVEPDSWDSAGRQDPVEGF